MIRPMRDTAIIPNEIQTMLPSLMSDTSAPITTKSAANCMAENSPDRNANTGIFSKAPFCCLQKQRFFSMFHTSDNTPLHLIFRADMRLPHIPVEGQVSSSFSCVPCAWTVPSFTTTMLSAPTMVDSRCAITIRVLPTVKAKGLSVPAPRSRGQCRLLPRLK